MLPLPFGGGKAPERVGVRRNDPGGVRLSMVISIA
jgi:hypothetical protein